MLPELLPEDVNIVKSNPCARIISLCPTTLNNTEHGTALLLCGHYPAVILRGQEGHHAKGLPTASQEERKEKREQLVLIKSFFFSFSQSGLCMQRFGSRSIKITAVS